MAQATVNNRAVLAMNCIGSLPCMMHGGTAGMATTGVATIAQPYTIVAGSWVSPVTSASYNTILSDTGGANGLYMRSSGNADLVVNGVDHLFVAPLGTWQSLQAVGNGASGSGVVNGTTTPLNTAATNLATASVLKSFNDGSDAYQGALMEFGVWASGFSATQLTNMDGNIRAFGGY